jgi:hypothetical protein
MTDDDEVGFDLTAWEAPPAPSGIADAVIARVEAPLVVGAVEAEQPRKLRWWMIAGPLVVAAAAVLAIVATSRTVEDELVGGSGAVATAKPSHLELGRTAVDLEAATDLVWTRDGKRITAMQPRGRATWKVGANEELRIDAGAMGASVVASGASLRVEVDMNLSDARLIGASAVTAAAVALVTVIVYEGHVKVTSAEKTVEVASGSTVQIAPNKPPVVPDQISGREKRLESKIKFLELENELLRKKLEPEWLTPSDIASFRGVMKPLDAKLEKCRLGSTVNEMTLNITVEDRGGLKIQIPTKVTPEAVECVDQILTKADFTALKVGTYSYEVAFEAVAITGPAKPAVPKTVPNPPPAVDPTPVVCSNTAEVERLSNVGDSYNMRGNFQMALQAYEKIVKCNKNVAAKAYLAACRARNFPRAKQLFDVIGKESLAQICLKEGFDPRRP